MNAAAASNRDDSLFRLADGDECVALNLQKPSAAVSTGIGFLDHMLDQLYSHAQIGIDGLRVVSSSDDGSTTTKEDPNRYALLDDDQKPLLRLVGSSVGKALRKLLSDNNVKAGQKSRFACPLDEALTVCNLEAKLASDATSGGQLQAYTLAPYGKYPITGRKYIGKLQTSAMESFWQYLAQESQLNISLEKIRGDNAHHIVESSFKAFARALRNLVDGIDTTTTTTSNNNSDDAALDAMYGQESDNAKASIALQRKGSVTRQTKETSIAATCQFDGGAAGVAVATGVTTLDHFLTQFAKAADLSLQIQCRGDLWIDEHHTAEDVAIAVGQVLTQALGTKAGLNRMWCARTSSSSTTAATNDNSGGRDNDDESAAAGVVVEVTMDLSNRPCLTHNLSLNNNNNNGAAEKVGDLSLEMFEHVLDSVVVNARMTVHICELQQLATSSNNSSSNENDDDNYNKNLEGTVTATAQALGRALKYCAMIDGRRAGATASSKGTLSV